MDNWEVSFIRHYTDLNNVLDSGVQGVPCTSQKTWGFFYVQKKIKQISGIAKRPGLVGFATNR